MNYYINMIADKELREAASLAKKYIEAEINGDWEKGQKLRKETVSKRSEAYHKIRNAHIEKNLPFNWRKTKQMCGL
jgi:hypothetical protein